MPFAKGQSGNPNGRPRKEKGLTDALTRALSKRDEDGRLRKDLFAERVVALALDGDVQAARLIMNYVDGMPTQQVDLTSGGEALYKTFRESDVERV